MVIFFGLIRASENFRIFENFKGSFQWEECNTKFCISSMIIKVIHARLVDNSHRFQLQIDTVYTCIQMYLIHFERKIFSRFEKRSVAIFNEMGINLATYEIIS